MTMKTVDGACNHRALFPFGAEWMTVAVLIVTGILGGSFGQAQSSGQSTAEQPLKPMAKDANPVFQVATIKPSDPEAQGRGLGLRGHNFSAHNFTLNDLVVFAYGVHEKQIVGGPAWLAKDKFDIAAVPDAEGQPSADQFKIMLQKLMADRFKLAFHHEMRELAVFALTVSKNGEKLTKNESGDPGPGRISMRLTKGGMMIVSRNATMAEFASTLQEAVVDRPVVNQSGLSGRFDFQFTFAPDGSQFGGMRLPQQSDDGAAPSLFTVIQELGLKLDTVKAQVDVLVIDHVEKPSED
jgi:uncharacterized protein (TIGR03435 family)